jgi:glucose-1-phosphate cytidylyltransferase
MKVIILSGGFGTRISEYTSIIPKPMIRIGGKPIIEHIMEIYSKYGHKDFYLALGYKSEVIKEYFYNYAFLNSNFQINLKDGKVTPFEKNKKDWTINLIDTGINTMTGGRLKRLKKFIGDETFLLTYGDAVTDLNINKVLEFHKKHGKMVTVTGVRPPARFGELTINDKNEVLEFKEKPNTQAGWINGGFFVINSEVIDMIEGDSTVWEQEPLNNLASQGELMAFKHNSFWQPMDTLRDKIYLEKLWSGGKAPWKVW